MKYIPVRGQTANIGFVFIPDSTSTVGAGKTGLTNASAGLNISVRRELSSAVSAYTGANIGAIATLGTWVNPGTGKCNIKEVDATNMPGLYELHFVDLIFGTGDASRKLIGMVTVTGGVPGPFEIQLTGVDIQDAAGFGLSRIDAAISTRSTLGGTAQTGDAFARLGAAGAGLTALGDTRIANLDAAVSSRSTFAAGQNVGTATSVTGAVGSVTGNVGGSVGSVASFGTLVADVATAVWGATVRTLSAFGFTPNVVNLTGTVADKTGYALSGPGVTAVQSGLATSSAVAAVAASIITFPTATVTGTPTITSVNVTGLADTTANAYKDAYCLFLSGVNAFAVAFPVLTSTYAAGTTTLTFTGLLAAPAVSDTLILLGSKKSL